jgi:hypothetical protein
MDMPVETPRIRLKTLASLALTIALASTVFAAPAFAQSPHGGGGGHGSSGGGHMSGGGGASHFAARPSYGAAGHGTGAYSGYAHANVNFAAPVRVGAYANAPSARANFAAGGARYVPGRYGSGVGYSHWNGGYWRGGFWPRVFWGANYAWFLPVLPAYCATYWWNNVPYYYYNDVYYTYDPSASGYVMTTPPPARPRKPMPRIRTRLLPIRPAMQWPTLPMQRLTTHRRTRLRRAAAVCSLIRRTDRVMSSSLRTKRNARRGLPDKPAPMATARRWITSAR